MRHLALLFILLVACGQPNPPCHSGEIVQKTYLHRAGGVIQIQYVEAGMSFGEPDSIRPHADEFILSIKWGNDTCECPVEEWLYDQKKLHEFITFDTDGNYVSPATI